MKIIYLAHPISGNIESNLLSIRKLVRHINLTMPEVVPFVPYYADIVSLDDNDPIERARGIQNDTHILMSGIVDELWLCGPRISAGMRAEADVAALTNTPVIHKPDICSGL